MTDTPAEVAEALAMLDQKIEYAELLHTDWADNMRVAHLATIRAHIANLERQLAEARANIERRPEDVVIPLALYDEINATGAQWKERAEAAESQLAEARGELAAKDEAYRLQFEACAQLAAQRERDGRDAERYRWIREQASKSPTTFEVVEDAAWTAKYGLPHNFDMNIDDAMKADGALVPVPGGE
jgi:multidrug resistance efflux pump